MSHHINGFIGPPDELKRLFKDHSAAKVVSLNEGLAFVPFTWEVAAQVGNAWYDVGKQCHGTIVHVETDYFGGAGEQSAAVWTNGWKGYRGKSAGGPINQALKKMGVKAKDGMDEFDTLGLGQWRSNEDWADNAPKL